MNRSLTVDIIADVSRFNAGMGQALNSLTKFGEKAQQVGTALSVGLSAPLGLIASKAIQAYGEMDALTRGLATLEKNAGTLKSRLSELQEVAKLPGLGYKEAIQFDISLRSAGFSAELSKRSMLAFGNALGSVGKGKEELRGVSLQLQQLATKTGGFGADIRVIKEYAPQVGAALQAAFGTIDTEKIAKMGVTGKQVVEKVVTELEKLPKATGGIKNAFENLEDSTFRSLAKLGQSISNSLGLEDIVNKIGSVIASLVDKFANLSPATQKIVAVFGALAIAIPPILATLGLLASTVIPAIIAGFGLIAGPVGLVVAAIAGAATLIVMHWDRIKQALVNSKVWDTLKSLVQNGLGFVTSVFGVFANLFQGDWSNLWVHAQNITKYGWNAIVDIIASGTLFVGSAIAKLLSLAGATNWATKLKANLNDFFKASKDLKFTIAPPKVSGNLFSGFNFGGGNSGKGTDLAGDEGKKKKEKYESYVDSLRKHLGELEEEIQTFSAKGLAIPDALIKSWASYSDMVKRADDALKDLQKTEISNVKPIDPNNVAGSYKEGNAQATRTYKFSVALQGGGSLDDPKLPGLDKLEANLKKAAENIKQGFGKVNKVSIESLQQLQLDINNGLQAAAQAALVGIGELIGNMIAGAASLSDLPKLIGGIFADLAKTMGSALIAFGTAGLAAKNLIKNPATAIIAGVALVALGAGLQATLSKQANTAFARPMADGGIVSGPTHILAGEYGSSRTNPEVIAPLSKLKGYIAGMGGGGGILTTRVSGSDLQIILDRNAKNQQQFGNG